MASMVDEQQRELLALVSWLQTFPEFGISIYDGGENLEDIQRLHSSLSTIDAARSISKVAEAVCDLDHPAEFDNGSTEQIWTSLLIMTSTRARPLPKEARREGNDNRITPARLKLYVLGNLLDCAVQTQDLQKRRMYIERIMRLTKSVQKTLMSLIERRGSKKVTPSSTSKAMQSTQPDMSSPLMSTHSKASAESVGNKSSQPTKKLSPPSETPTLPYREEKLHERAMSPPLSRSATKILVSNHQLQSGLNAISSPGNHRISDEVKKYHREDCEDVETNASSATECRSNTSQNRTRQILKYPDKAGRLFSSAFSPKSCTGFTPEQKRCFSGKPNVDKDERSTFLSPGMMDSPYQLTEMIHDIKSKNEEYQSAIDSYKQREDELIKKMEEMEAEYRKKLMKVESKGLDRIQEMQRTSEEKIEYLQKELESTRFKALEGASALHELKIARDELELLSHGKGVLADTTEKLRKYKEKLNELQDVKEAFQRSQDSHAKCVEDVVRLESEIKSLQPLKRQVEEYRFRAVEAEVKLVECQDYLRRIEQHADDQSQKNQHLLNGAVMQKEQLEELQRRIQKETDSLHSNNSGVGDGISELNPDLNQELIRLRGENLQLRAFAAKRESDSVQYLEESLEDAKQLADRYKQEFLGTKETLSNTQSMLDDSRRLESTLRDEANDLGNRAQEAEAHCEQLDRHLTECEKEMEITKAKLQQTYEQNETLQNEVTTWKKKTHDSEKMSNDRMERLKNVLGDLEETTNNLRSTEQLVHDLREDVSDLETQSNKYSAQLQTMKRRVQQASEDLHETQARLKDSEKRVQSLETQLNKLTTEKANLQEQLKVERKMRQEESLEAQQSLDATRQVLEAKHNKEMEELQSNMTRLLEDERRAVREKDESAKKQQKAIRKEWQDKYEELEKTSANKLAEVKETAKETEERLQKDHHEQLAKERKEGSETHDRLIRKGKSMLEEAKKKARDEILRLDCICKELEENSARIEKEKDEMENQLSDKISNLKQKLEFSSNQVNSLSQDADEFQEKIKALEREKFKLQEDNDRFRRQLGGRFGVDGKVQSTLENLQKEYNALLEENRKLKMEAKEGGASVAFFDSLLHSEDESNTSQSYRRGAGMNGSTLTQLRQEYEETIESLNDEKRELIMRNSAAVTDVQKAEQRSWEREQECSKLKAEITSLNLALQRASFSREQELEANNDSASHDSAHNKTGTPSKSSANGMHGSTPTRSTRSPGIERASQHKAAQENELRNRFSSLLATAPSSYSRSPPRIPSTNNELALTNSDSADLRDDAKSSRTEQSNNYGSSKSSTSDSSDFQQRHDSIPHTKCDGSIQQMQSDTDISNHSSGLGEDCGGYHSNSYLPKDDGAWNSRFSPFRSTEETSSDTSQSTFDGRRHASSNEQRYAEISDGVVPSSSSLTSNSSASPTTDSERNNQGAIRSFQKVDSAAAISASDIADGNLSKPVSSMRDSNETGSATSLGSAGKHVRRFDKWLNGSNPNLGVNEEPSVYVRRFWKSSESGVSTEEHGKTSRDNESTPKKGVRRKSANFQKAASVFEAAASKGSNSVKQSVSPFRGNSSYSVISSTEKRSESNKISQSTNKILSVSKKHEQQANTAQQNARKSETQLPQGITNKNTNTSKNSSAFKMASAVFEVGANNNKLATRSPFLHSKSPPKSSDIMHKKDASQNSLASKRHQDAVGKNDESTSQHEDDQIRTSASDTMPSIVEVTQINHTSSAQNHEGSECKQS